MPSDLEHKGFVRVTTVDRVTYDKWLDARKTLDELAYRMFPWVESMRYVYPNHQQNLCDAKRHIEQAMLALQKYAESFREVSDA